MPGNWPKLMGREIKSAVVFSCFIRYIFNFCQNRLEFEEEFIASQCITYDDMVYHQIYRGLSVIKNSDRVGSNKYAKTVAIIMDGNGRWAKQKNIM